MYIVIFNSSNPILMKEDTGELSFFEDHKEAERTAKEWIDGHHFRDYEIFKLIEK